MSVHLGAATHPAMQLWQRVGTLFVAASTALAALSLAAGTAQAADNAPAVAALNSWHTVVSWVHHKARHLQRPERFDGTTRIVSDP